MKSKAFGWTISIIGALVLATGTSALAQDSIREYSRQKEFKGVINAYSPQTKTTTTTPTGTTTTSTGPYEIRGPWSLKLKRDSDKADFSAALNMELSDGWVLTPAGGNGNFDPKARGAHTHHITLDDADVTQITNGFRVSGPATITLNGTPAPVSPSVLTIDITGGGTGDGDVEYSNITLTFDPPGSKHFGSGPLPGVVQSVKEER